MHFPYPALSLILLQTLASHSKLYDIHTYTSTTKFFFVLCFYSPLIHLHRASSFCILIFVPFVKMEGVAKWDEEKVYHKIFKNLFQLILFLLLKLFSLFSQMWRNNLWQRLFAHLKMYVHKELFGCISVNWGDMNAFLLEIVVFVFWGCKVDTVLSYLMGKFKIYRFIIIIGFVKLKF